MPEFFGLDSGLDSGKFAETVQPWLLILTMGEQRFSTAYYEFMGLQ